MTEEKSKNVYKAETQKNKELGLSDARRTLKDVDIREGLFEFLEETFGRVRVIEEKIIGRSRADVILVMEDSLCGIEIKSDADTYVRLESQVPDYDKYYDQNIVVVGTSHAMHIAEHVPDYWGIITVEEVEGDLDFYILRDPGRNPKMDPKCKISILWRPELAHILEKNEMPRYLQRSKLFVAERILKMVPEEILWQQVSEELFQRDYNTIAEEIELFKAMHPRKKRKKRRL